MPVMSLKPVARVCGDSHMETGCHLISALYAPTAYESEWVSPD